MKRTWQMRVCVALSVVALMCGAAEPKEVLRIGVDADASFLGYSGADGTPVGYDIIVMRCLAAEAGLEVEFVTMPLAEIMDAIAAGNLDGVAGIPWSIGALKVVHFLPFTSSTPMILYGLPQQEQINDFESLRNKRITVQAWTPHVMLSEMPMENITAVLTRREMIDRVKNGLSDYYWTRRISRPPEGLVERSPSMGLVYGGPAIARDRPVLLARLKQAMHTLRANGVLQAHYRNHFNKPREDPPRFPRLALNMADGAYSHMNPETGEVEGFFADLVKSFEQLDVTCVPMTLENLHQALRSGAVDMVVDFDTHAHALGDAYMTQTVAVRNGRRYAIAVSNRNPGLAHWLMYELAQVRATGAFDAIRAKWLPKSIDPLSPLRVSVSPILPALKDRVMGEAFRRIGYAVRWDVQTTKGAIEQTHLGYTAGIAAVDPHALPSSLIPGETQFLPIRCDIFMKTNQANHVHVGLRGLQGLRVGFVEGRGMVASMLPFDVAMSVTRKTFAELMNLLQTDQIDAVLEMVQADQVIRGVPADICCVDVVGPFPLTYALGKSYQELQPALETALARMYADGSMERLMAGAESKKVRPRILCVCEYSAGTMKRQLLPAMIERAFPSDRYDVHYEYLNMPGSETMEEWREACRKSLYLNHARYSYALILAFNRMAMNCVRDQYNYQFHDVPAVFTGVQFGVDVLREGIASFVTAVRTANGVAEAVRAIVQLNPAARTVYFVADAASTAQAQRAIAEETVATMAAEGRSITFRASSDLPFHELCEEIANLPRDAVIVVGSYRSDATEMTVPETTLVMGVSKNAPVPVILLNKDIYLERNILGTVSIDEREQIRRMLTLGEHALGGKVLAPVNSAPLVFHVNMPTVKALGWTQAYVRASVPELALTFAFAERPWYEKYGFVIVTSAGGVTLLLALLSGFLIWRRQILARERKVSERYRRVLEGKIKSEHKSKLALEAKNETIREAQDELERVMQVCGLGVWKYVAGDSYMTVSPAWLEQLGYASELFPDGRIPFRKSIWASTDLPLLRDYLQTILQADPASGGTRLTFRVRRGDRVDAVEWMEIIGFPSSMNAAGRAVITGFHLLISAQHRLAEERNALRDQLERSQRLEAIGTFAGGIAHDFNNILTVITGYADLLLMDMDEQAPAYADIQSIRDAGTRATKLVRQLLAFSSRKATTAQRVNLQTGIEELSEILKRVVGSQITFCVNTQATVWPVFIDPVQLEQILLNIIRNAVDALGTNGGKITVETENFTADRAWCACHVGVTPGDYVRLSIADNGPGICDDVKDHIFEPFFTTKGAGKGTGMGLATVYGIVRQNGGSIMVDSAEGEGARFIIYLPRATEAAIEDAVAIEALPHEHTAAGAIVRGAGETILYVDDDENVGLTHEMMFRNIGYNVIRFTRPIQALAYYAEHADDVALVVSDVVMPEMNGAEMIGKMLDIKPNLAGFFISGYTSDILQNGERFAHIGFIQKPVALATVSLRFAEALEKGKIVKATIKQDE